LTANLNVVETPSYFYHIMISCPNIEHIQKYIMGILLIMYVMLCKYLHL